MDTKKGYGPYPEQHTPDQDRQEIVENEAASRKVKEEPLLAEVIIQADIHETHKKYGIPGMEKKIHLAKTIAFWLTFGDKTFNLHQSPI